MANIVGVFFVCRLHMLLALLVIAIVSPHIHGRVAYAWKLWDMDGETEFRHDYKDALSKSILFFEGQRSGKLPNEQRLRWRSDSGLNDGMMENVDLVGGYYDAGDGVKFSFPMAFATTMLAWSVVEFGQELDMAGELRNARATIRWATDYLLKTTTTKPNTIYAQVGDPNSDHSCWERPEDMDTPRNVYSINPARPGSDLAAEIAAAFAASSLAFKASDPSYSNLLLSTAHNVFAFADTYRGSYSNAFSNAVCPFYCSYSGYQDELLWGAAWLYKASKQPLYLNFILNNKQQLAERSPPFSWDDKHAGVHVLLSQILLSEAHTGLQEFKDQADDFVCSVLPNDISYTQQSLLSTTPGGLLFVSDDENLQYVTSAAFLLFTYGKHLNKASSMVSCRGTDSSLVHPHELWVFAKHQVDYILGENPMKMSYMVGYDGAGGRFPRKLHHRGSSLPCVTSHPQRIGCKEGFSFFSSIEQNPNLLVGAVSGGPGPYDEYSDDRSNYKQSEPTLYINAPLVGTLAYLASF